MLLKVWREVVKILQIQFNSCKTSRRHCCLVLCLKEVYNLILHQTEVNESVYILKAISALENECPFTKTMTALLEPLFLLNNSLSQSLLIRLAHCKVSLQYRMAVSRNSD